MAKSTVDITELTMGVSKTGMTNYIEELKTSLITDVTTQLSNDNFTNVETVIRSGWSGKSCEKFLSDFAKRRANIISDLNDERDDLEKKLNEIKKAYYAIDKDLYGGFNNK